MAEQVGVLRQTRIRELLVANAFRERRHRRASRLRPEIGRQRDDERQRIAHLLRRRRVGAAEARVRQQRDARRDAEALHLLGREQRHLGDLLGRGVAIDVRVADEELPSRQDQHLHRRERLHAAAKADHVANMLQVIRIVAAGPAQHRIGVAAPNQHRADQRRAAAHLSIASRRVTPLRRAAGSTRPVVAIARVVEDVDAIAVVAEPEPQAELLDACRHDIGAAHEHRARQTFVDHGLRGAQHALVLAFGVDDALRRALGGREHRLHDQAGVIDEPAQAVAIGVEIGDRPRGDAAVHRGLRHRGRHARDQARIERRGMR